MGKFYKGSEDQFKAEVIKEVTDAFANQQKFVFADFEDVTLPNNTTIECLTILSPGEGLFYMPALDLYSKVLRNYDASVRDWALAYVGQEPILEVEDYSL